MAMTVNDKLAAEAVRRRLYLSRFSTGQALQLQRLLARLPPKVVIHLLDVIEGLTPAGMTTAKISKLQKAIGSIVSDAFAEVYDKLEDGLTTLAKVETNYHLVMLESAVPQVAAAAVGGIQTVSFSEVIASALSKPFQGKLLSQWAKAQSAQTVQTITNTVTSGVLQGKTTTEIIREIRGTKARNYADSVINQAPARNLSSVVKTAISHVSAEAREHMRAANNDLIRGRVWLSTLDSHTSPMCIIRDHLEYTAATNPKPVGHNVPYGAGPGRLHYCCRSTETWITASWQELGIKADDLTPRERASMNGAVPAKMNYAQWLEGQPAWVQEEVLGAQRAYLLQQGKATVPEMFSDKGEWLTLDQLRESDERIAKAFRAG